MPMTVWLRHTNLYTCSPFWSFEQAQASCDHSSGKVQIDAAYVEANTPIIREQLQKSGVRLAHLLDAALGK
jgi:hypothetical protein